MDILMGNWNWRWRGYFVENEFFVYCLLLKIFYIYLKVIVYIISFKCFLSYYIFRYSYCYKINGKIKFEL